MSRLLVYTSVCKSDNLSGCRSCDIGYWPSRDTTREADNWASHVYSLANWFAGYIIPRPSDKLEAAKVGDGPLGSLRA